MSRSTPAPIAVEKSILLDTGFLITVFDDQRPNHATALDLYKFFIEHGFLIFLSSIVVAEFCTRGDIKQLPLNNFLPLGFDIFDGALAGKLNFSTFMKPGGDRDRASVKDDVKLLAQMLQRNISYFATEDGPFTKKVSDEFRAITPILASDLVTKHFAVHRAASSTVVSRAITPGQQSLF